MMISMRGASSLILFVCVSVLVSSCYRLKPLDGQSTEVITSGNLGARVEFAIAPVVDLREVAESKIPDRQLRDAFAHALLKRRYSPLSLDYVDSKVVNASYEPGAAQEEAVLQITVMEWDSSLWQIHRALHVTIEAVAIDPEDPDGAVLWKARVARRFDKDDFGDPAHQPTEPLRLQHACDVIAVELLSEMPARTEAAGRL